MELIEAWLTEIYHLEEHGDPEVSHIENMVRISDLKMRVAHLIAKNNKRRQIIQARCDPSPPLSPSTSSDGSPLTKSDS